MSETSPKLSPVTSRSLSFIGWLAGSWLLMIVLGFSALRMEGALAARNPVSIERSVFVSVNAATQTGFAMGFARPSDFASVVQIIFGLQTLLGVLLSLIGGGVLLSRLLGLPHSDSRIALTSLVMIGFAAIVGVTTIGGGESLGYATYRGIAALGCSGLTFGNIPAATSPILLIALIPLSVIGSMGVVFMLELKDWMQQKTPINAHVRSAAALAGVVYVVGTLIAWLLTTDAVRASSIVLSARAYGMPVEFASAWPRGLVWWVIAIVLIGAGTAGAAGGLGVGYLATFRGRHLRPILIGVGVQFALLLVGVMILVQTEQQLAADRVLMIAASAAMGVGLSHDALTITGPGLYVLAFLMFASKLLPLGTLAIMLRNRLGSHTVVTLAIVDN